MTRPGTTRLQLRWAWHDPDGVTSYPLGKLREAAEALGRGPDTIGLYREGPDGLQSLIGETLPRGDGYLDRSS